MGKIENLLALARGGGVTLDGIKPVEIAGRGIGVIATRDLEPGDVILDIPLSAVRSIGSVASRVLRKLPSDLPFHGILAADLALDATAEFETWKNVLPTRADFAVAMPFMWHPELQALLPGAARELLKKQQSKFRQQWEVVAAAFPTLSVDDFAYYWLLVNTRTFYFETPGLEKYSWEDRLALLPVADLFNHAEEGCNVSYGEDGYTVTADCAYAAGSEVFISYGDHPNDLLLVEYGFLLAPNRWDAITLDEVVLPRMDQGILDDLARRGFSEPCTLSVEHGPSRQTHVAFRILTYPRADWFRYVDEAQTALEREPFVRVLWETLRQNLELRARERLGQIAKSSLGNPDQRKMLLQRWQQIKSITESDWDRYYSST